MCILLAKVITWEIQNLNLPVIKIQKIIYLLSCTPMILEFYVKIKNTEKSWDKNV